MALSLNPCCGSVTSVVSVMSNFLPPNCLSSVSSTPKSGLATLNHQYSSSADCLSIGSRHVLPFQRGIRQTDSIKQHRYSTISAGAKNTKIAPLTIRDAKIVAEPPKDNQLKVRIKYFSVSLQST